MSIYEILIGPVFEDEGLGFVARSLAEVERGSFYDHSRFLLLLVVVVMILADACGMKTIGTFSKVEDAHLVRMHLESAGIEAFVQDQNTLQLEQPWSEGAGGVRVEVADEDFDSAREFLAADRGVPPRTGDPRA